MKQTRIIIAFLAFISIFIVGVILLELRSILLPFVISVLLSNAFSPIAQYFNKKKFPTVIGLLVVLLISSIILALIGLVIFSSIESFINGVQVYEENLSLMVSQSADSIARIAKNWGIEIETIEWQEIIQISSITSSVTSGVGGFLGFLSDLFLVVLFMMFILASSGELRRKIVIAFPEERASKISVMLEKIDHQVRQYLVMKTIISLGTGLLTTIVLWVLGVDFPIIWGIIAFILNYIPNVGSIIATLFPFLFSLIQFQSFGMPLLILVVLGGIQMAMGNIVEPKVLASSMNLSPLLVLVALIFWGWLWGIAGMILAIPLTAIIKIVIGNLQPLAPIALLMSENVGKRDSNKESESIALSE